MKRKRKFLKGLFYLLVLTMGWSACESDPDPLIPVDPPFSLKGVFILNQGQNDMNNASLSHYDPETGSIYTIPFESALGDVGQDILVYGNKLYISVSNSSYIRVLDVTTKKAIKDIPLLDNQNNMRNPRYLVSCLGNVYVSCVTDGTVARIDTASLSVTGNVKVGNFPEGITFCPFNSKIYVANSGWGTGNTISVINPVTLTEEWKMDVGQNPNIIKAGDDAYLYLSYQGDFGDIPGGFQRIDVRDNSVKNLSDYPKADFTLSGNHIYFYDVTYNPLDWSMELLFGKFDITGNFNAYHSIITDKTNIVSPYGIAVNPISEDVFIADAIDYVNPGKVYIFNPEGKKVDELNVGIVPCKIVVY
ncbi:hypothetical protein AGMMS50262_18100 [Bacteroidia bacterium]|nr:hypothetical protein AGMMS50262_18100 [Bacteroidia bacterium]